jgi:hypothetical protein
MKRLFLTVLTIALFITSFTAHCADEISLASELSIDAVPMPKRFFFLGMAATAGLLYAGYNLHDLLHADQNKKTACKRSIGHTENNSRANHVIPILYSITFMAAAGYLSYICAESIMKDLALKD